MLLSLVKEELYENRRGFFILPALVCVVCILLSLLVVLNGSFSIEVSNVTIDEADQILSKIPHTASFLFTLYTPFVILLWLVVLHYFLYCLYNLRQQKEMKLAPIKYQYLLAKIITGLLLVPLVVWLMLVVTQFTCLFIITLYTYSMIHMSLIDIWVPLNLLRLWFMLLLSLGLQALALLPVVGWFLLVSAFARRSPLLIAIGLPLIVASLEHLLFATHYLSAAISSVLSNITYGSSVAFHQSTIETALTHLQIVPHIAIASSYLSNVSWGTVIGLLLIVAAAQFHREKIDI